MSQDDILKLFEDGKERYVIEIKAMLNLGITTIQKNLNKLFEHNEIERRFNPENHSYIYYKPNKDEVLKIVEQSIMKPNNKPL